MTIEKKINGEALTLIVSGRLDTQTAPELENELDSVLADIKETCNIKNFHNAVINTCEFHAALCVHCFLCFKNYS